MSSFKEFLKKEVFDLGDDYYLNPEQDADYLRFNKTNGKLNCIPVRSLGEWAFEEFLKYTKQYEEAYQEEDYFDFLPDIKTEQDWKGFFKEWSESDWEDCNESLKHWIIAVSCLGEKEVKKRLEALK